MLVGQGIYTLQEAARLARFANVNPSARTIGTWLYGREDRTRPLLSPDYERGTGRRAMSFYDLIDTVVVSTFRARGFSLQAIRAFIRELEREVGGLVQHPMSRREVVSLGKKLLLRTVDAMGDVRLTDIVKKQEFFARGLEPVLAHLDYDPLSKLAHRWRIATGVVIDPERGYGRPIVDEAGVATSVLAGAYAANGLDASATAEFFGVEVRDVELAVSFESTLNAA